MALGYLALAASAMANPLADHSLGDLEKRLAAIDSQLEDLADYGLGSGIGAIGYRSIAHSSQDQHEWIQIDFGKEVPLDEVMLIPCIRRDVDKGFQADAFPAELRLIAGTKADTNGTLIAEYACNGSMDPGVAPFVTPCNGIAASWIRVESDTLTPRAFDNLYVFQFSEILVFSGEENVALKKTVASSSDQPNSSGAWDKDFVVDGFVPYLMDAAHGEQSIAYLTPPSTNLHPALTLDLESSHPISRIHLHAVGASDTLPQAYAGDIGIPKRLHIAGANVSDFSDAVPLLDQHFDTIYDIGSIMMWHIPDTTCRYVHLSVVEPSSNTLYGDTPPRLGFSEIELFSNGRNVALGKSVKPNFDRPNPHRPLVNLTDGRNMYGNILPIRDWLNQLALRHKLEKERPLITAELTRRYTRQKTTLLLTGWLAALLAIGTVITILVDRIIRQRAIFRTRERIAADLHDELGANIHAIGLLGDLAQAAKESPAKLDKLLQRMRALTERTGAAARHCTNMLEAKDLYGDLVDDMRKTSARIMADLDYRLEFEGEELLSRLKLRKRIDLFLFYKECLINIIRHSGATEVHANLAASNTGIELTISDNGHGLDGGVPSSLKRRARLLGALVKNEASETGGTKISLIVKHGKLGALL
ncbi:Sensor histidine kinase LiaS [Pontiella desulfatans]|uniref:Sensor histidine kinase LiaS n=1 Tax=Pontiella desulfatans TaxID=2750659 RepID=A0A6C2TY02_PONDE|nr:histidine kinase [Pontiella desulfatans]VGO12492.1 Sensor histidine kinase LiaS [Pontiella desulfatans]